MTWRLPALAAVAALSLEGGGSCALAAGILSERPGGGAGWAEAIARDLAPVAGSPPIEQASPSMPTIAPAGERAMGVAPRDVLDGWGVRASARADLSAFSPEMTPILVSSAGVRPDLPLAAAAQLLAADPELVGPAVPGAGVPIPEPTSLVLLITGIVGAIWARKHLRLSDPLAKERGRPDPTRADAPAGEIHPA